MSKSKIYTRSGDAGTTSLIGGMRVKKNSPRIEAYGTIDELIASLGVLRSLSIDDLSKESILRIQKQLFKIGASLANPLINNAQGDDKEIEFLESEIDRIEIYLPPLKNFIIPGGHPVSAQCNMARTVCRRAERKIIEIPIEDSTFQWNIKYINRLSDYLFILSRHFSNYFNLFDYVLDT